MANATEKNAAQLIADAAEAKRLKDDAAAKLSAANKAARAAGVKTGTEKQRQTPKEIIGSVAKSTVERFLNDVLPSDDDTRKIKLQEAKVAEWKGLLASASDTTRPMIQDALNGAETLLQMYRNTAAGTRTVEAETLLKFRKIAVALMKDGKITAAQLGLLIRPHLEVFPAVGFTKK